MNVKIKQNYLKSLFLLIICVIGVIAYEIHLYGFYFIISFFSFFILSLFVLFIKNEKIKLNMVWIFILFFYILAYLISIIYNLDVLGLVRLLISFIVCLACMFFVKYIDEMFKLLTVVLFPIAIASLLIQFTNILSPIWDLTFGRNSSIFFDPNFASAFLGLAAIISLQHINHKIKYLFFIIFSLACFFTFSKAGALALIFSIFLLYLRKFNILQFLIFSTLFSSLVLFTYINSDLTMFRFEQGLNERDNLWNFVFNYVFQYQNFLGIGYDNLKLILNSHGFVNSSTHNFYFDTLITYGVLPFIMNLLLSLFIMIFMFINNSKHLASFFFLFVQSNSILISFGGMGFLSILLTLMAVSQMLQDKKAGVQGG